jgi:hypothetical protein
VGAREVLRVSATGSKDLSTRLWGLLRHSYLLSLSLDRAAHPVVRLTRSEHAVNSVHPQCSP